MDGVISYSWQMPYPSHTMSPTASNKEGETPLELKPLNLALQLLQLALKLLELAPLLT